MRIATLIVLLATITGCTTNLTSATPAYKLANQARLKAVEPWLRTYSADHPTDAVKVSDQLQAWKIEIDAQQRTATTVP